MTAEPDPYIALKLEPGSTLEQVKEQYRRLAKEYHPDLNPHDRAASEERLRRLNAAYALLSDPAHKAMLDRRREREQAQRSASGPRAANRPAARPHPVTAGDAKRRRPKSARTRTPARPLTRAERKRVRVAAASIGLAVSLAVVGMVYYEWWQPTPLNHAGIAPSLGADPIEAQPAGGAWSSPPPMALVPYPPPTPADDEALPADASAEQRALRVKQKLQSRMEEVDPKITALISAVQTVVADDEKMDSASPEHFQWRTQLATDSHAMLLQRDMVRFEIEDLASRPSQKQQDALIHIKTDSEILDQQYQRVREELRQKPR
ncbi:MAG: DnaJ domain-containing protein [Capsulimonas sp.]|uniref:DnaJ domain-containing protein n=1 Tax=Capsulimonas sp. TaxID=2494211 RepID=UPI003263186F